MRTDHHLVLGALLAACALLFSSASAQGEPSEQERLLLTKVKVLWSANRGAIKTVQCEYYDDLNGANTHVRYARDGEMYYHGSRVINYDGRFGIMSEVAWDGQRSANRHSFGLMNFASSPESALTSNQTPDDSVGHFAERALGLVDDPENRCEFLGASETEYEGRPVVELRYKRVLDQDTVIIRHGKDVGYWPVHLLRNAPGGGTFCEMKDVKYARFESQGNVLFYPVYAYRGVYFGARYPKGKYADNHLTLVVDEKTLKVNEPIPLSRFTITPWPSEQVHDVNTDRWIEPTDPNWSAVGKVDFPWDKVAAGFEKAIAEQKAANAKVVAAAPRPQTAANVAPARKAAPAPSGSLGEYLNPPLIGGVVLLAGSGYWLYRRRRAA